MRVIGSGPRRIAPRLRELELKKPSDGLRVAAERRAALLLETRRRVKHLGRGRRCPCPVGSSHTGASRPINPPGPNQAAVAQNFAAHAFAAMAKISHFGASGSKIRRSKNASGCRKSLPDSDAAGVGSTSEPSTLEDAPGNSAPRRADAGGRDQAGTRRPRAPARRPGQGRCARRAARRSKPPGCARGTWPRPRGTAGSAVRGGSSPSAERSDRSGHGR